jgi:thioredoxin-related protein
VALNEDTTATEKAIADLLGVRFTPTIVFLGQDNRPVARVNGYRNPQDFKQVLDYVAARAYRHQSLSDYLNGVRAPGVYQPRPHPQLSELKDLSQAGDRPLAVLVEDSACVACDDLHDGHLARPEVRLALADFTFVRVDALSEEPMIDPSGNATTPKDWVKGLGLTYRPGILLFDRGEEHEEIDGLGLLRGVVRKLPETVPIWPDTKSSDPPAPRPKRGARSSSPPRGTRRPVRRWPPGAMPDRPRTRPRPPQGTSRASLTSSSNRMVVPPRGQANMHGRGSVRRCP